MRQEASLQQWEKLYDLGIKIKELSPWEYLWDMELAVILLPDYEEPFYCSIMGRGGQCFAVAVYYGTAILGFLKTNESTKIPVGQLIRYQDNLICYFADREELSRQELKLIKDLGLKFRGRKQWIHFQSFEPGFAPFMLDKQEVARLTDVFEQLYIGLMDYQKKEILVEFEDGEALIRFYNQEQGSWITAAGPIILPRLDFEEIKITNDLLIARLNKAPRTRDRLEIDLVYLRAWINDENFSKPVIPRVLMMVDAQSGMIIDHDVLPVGTDIPERVLIMLIDYIVEAGKPKSIYVRDELFASYLKNLAEKLTIELQIKEGLTTIDALTEVFDQENMFN